LTSEATARAQAFVNERLPEARGLGESLAELIGYPDEFVIALREGLTRLADDAYAREQERVAPASGPVFGVRAPLIVATMRQVRPALKESSPAIALWLAERLTAENEREFVFFCHLALERSMTSDSERTWQLMRRLARRATDWIRVDTLAELFAKGILLEPVRWAELEQLIYSASTWERRLVGSTIARLPFEVPRQQRPKLVNIPALNVLGQLVGDAEPDVQKALSWALRSWLEVDGQGVREFIRFEAHRAVADEDGHRAWVLRDALTAPSLEAPFVKELRDLLATVRRKPGQPATSSAAHIARQFAGYERLSDSAVSQQGDRQRLAGGADVAAGRPNVGAGARG
jgi:3-methyladenine DNA glycosylase AlkD